MIFNHNGFYKISISANPFFHTIDANLSAYFLCHRHASCDSGLCCDMEFSRDVPTPYYSAFYSPFVLHKMRFGNLR